MMIIVSIDSYFLNENILCFFNFVNLFLELFEFILSFDCWVLEENMEVDG